MQSTLRCAHRPWGGLPRDGRQRSTINRAQQPRLRIKSDARNPVVCHDWEAKPHAGLPRGGGTRKAPHRLLSPDDTQVRAYFGWNPEALMILSQVCV